MKYWRKGKIMIKVCWLVMSLFLFYESTFLSINLTRALHTHIWQSGVNDSIHLTQSVCESGIGLNLVNKPRYTLKYTDLELRLLHKALAAKYLRFFKKNSYHASLNGFVQAEVALTLFPLSNEWILSKILFLYSTD